MITHPEKILFPDDGITKGDLAAYYEAIAPTILPHIKAKKKVLIAAHGNSLRALLKHLEGLSEAEIEAVNLPTGIPKVYELNDRFTAKRHYFLGDPNEVANRIQSVANQTKRS